MIKFKQIMKQLFWGCVLCGVAGLSGALGMGCVVLWEVYYGDDSTLRKTTILAKIKEETTLYYLDEETRIGSIFESQHRRYIPIDEVPPHVINALIGAEDQDFYSHIGVDPIAIFKAIGEGIASGGRFRRGGSTITQQTVKNIMDDWEASFARKFREMIKSIQLEKLYTKRQILEFYLNQFHVAGNGNGIGIAAKYYFDKPVHELSLVEGAFIAGSVKGPSKYNPFIKYTKESRELAKKNANERKNYVLRRMFEQKWISEEDYNEGLKTEIPFKRGEFRNDEVALVDLIKSQLKQPEVLEALKLNSEADLNVAGLKVYTTLDADMQKVSQLAIRQNLSKLETTLKGYSPESEEEFKILRTIEKEGFYFGKIESISGTGVNDLNVKINFGLPKGTIPPDSFERYAKLIDLAEGVVGGWQEQVKRLRKKLKVGDVLFVEVMEYDEETHEAILELRKRPTINGGVMAIDKGEVRSVVSGFDTLGFNRSMHAKKQPGSVFKSVVYFAALQLGWSILDRVDNSRQMFPFQGQFYYPRPDHSSPFSSASILWSGISSENLSSVALGYKLVEKLNFQQFKELMGFMGYLPLENEQPRDFHYRVARETGVSIDNKGIKEFQLQNAVNDLAPDLVFSGSTYLLDELKRMWWGEGYLAEMDRLYDYNSSNYSIKELGIRLDLIRNNFQRYEKLSADLSKDWNFLTAQFSENEVEAVWSKPDIQSAVANFKVLSSSGNRPALGYVKNYEGEEIPRNFKEDQRFMLRRSAGRDLNMLDAQAIWGKSGFFGSGGSAGINQTDVKLNAKLPLSLFVQLQSYLNQRYQQVVANTDKFDLPRYFQHHDFRIALGLNYIVKLGRAMGIHSPLQPVLSFPLGTNDVTVSEVAKVYQTFISGKTYRFFDKGLENQLTFIRRVEDRLGNILYEAEGREHQLVSKENTLQMQEILRKIVTHGTGRRARGELYVELDQNGQPIVEEHEKNKSEKLIKIRVPAFGKTGTTNDFTTSYFAGFLPYPTKKTNVLDPENSYVIASYVGFDDNTMMRKGRFKVYGSNGALPLWTDFAKGIIKAKHYAEKLDSDDITVLSRKEWPVKVDEKTTPLMVDLPRGLVIRSGANSDIETWDTTDLSKTGETFEDYFALGSGVKSIVQIPPDYSSGNWQPLKMFSLYRKRPVEGEKAVVIKDSKIEEDGNASIDSGANTPAATDTNPVVNNPNTNTSANGYEDDYNPGNSPDSDVSPNSENSKSAGLSNNEIKDKTANEWKDSQEKSKQVKKDEGDEEKEKDKDKGYTEDDLW